MPYARLSGRGHFLSAQQIFDHPVSHAIDRAASDTGVFLRRAFRILLLYLLAVGFYVLASFATHTDVETTQRIWINLLFLTGWFIFAQGVPSVPFTITWSLSVEEFGYILLGLMTWISRQRLWAFVVFLCLTPLALRYALVLPLFA